VRCNFQLPNPPAKRRTFQPLFTHQTPPDRVLANLETAVEQLPYNTCGREAEVVAKVLEANTPRRRDAVAVGEILPAVLARLNIRTTEHEHRDRS